MKRKKEPDFDLVIRVRNNHIVAWRERLGLTAPQAAEKVGLPYELWIKYESCRVNPMSKKGELRPSALKLSVALSIPPDNLWPEAIRKVQSPIVRMQTDAPEFFLGTGAIPAALPSPEDVLLEKERHKILEKKIQELPPLHQRRVCRVLGVGEEEMGVVDLAEKEDVCRGRIYQTLDAAARKIRYRCTSEELDALRGDSRPPGRVLPSCRCPPAEWLEGFHARENLLTHVPANRLVIWYGLGGWSTRDNYSISFPKEKQWVKGYGDNGQLVNSVRGVLEEVRKKAMARLRALIEKGTDEHGYAFWVKSEYAVVLHNESRFRILADLYPRNEKTCVVMVAHNQ